MKNGKRTLRSSKIVQGNGMFMRWELVEVVADQVAVALSHAAILEESMRARDLLMEQNISLDHLARREAETAIRARNDFLAVMNHEMRELLCMRLLHYHLCCKKLI
ncbi:hypothetical protein POM88_046858 [Heracleum sosnowskyi]|uniref:Uncharacterized protein n=1 Tax=Heracleum sosnowskyi TaxID=360622 RepID=A0AAD8H9R9_9APIA|nr:hypothetical protein POM88_046858 [Heracleum sosnowskyi]